MPRKKSELTGSRITISVRTTEAQKIAFLRLGGSAWLRKQIEECTRAKNEASNKV